MASVQDIYNEIDRINQAKGEIAGAIGEKGVDVPEQAKINEYPGYVRQIQTGSPDAVLYTPQELTPEQQGQARENIGAGTYTKPDTGIPETDLAQGVQTLLEKANTAYQKPNGGIPKTDLATAVQNSLGKADTALQPAALTPITDLIPEQATPQNQLADKNFVNSSVATNTANYISDNGQPFQSVADLEAYSGTLTNNDYAFVVGTDSAGNTTYTRYKYNANTGEWAEEYVLNNSSFTAEQWAAISSGITALLVQKLSDLPTEVVTYVAQTLTDAQKQQARANIGATAPEIFWAEYGVTTYADVLSAYDDGKIVMVERSNTKYIAQFKDSNNGIRFYAPIGTNLFMVIIGANGVWSSSSYSIQQTADKSQSIPTDRESTTKYPSVKAVFDSLGKWGVISQTISWSGNNATGYDYTMSDPVWGLIPQANIDMFERVGAIFNDTGADITRRDMFGYDITHKNGCFYLEGLGDISYQEMIDIYESRWSVNNLPVNSAPAPAVWSATKARYGLKTFNQNWNGTVNVYMIGAYTSRPLTIINLTTRDSSQTTYLNAVRQCFYQTSALKRIYPFLNCSSCTGTGAAYNAFYDSFSSCFSLEDIRLKSLKIDIGFPSSSRLTIASVVYIVDNAANTTAITIKLHATAYARCVADTTEYEYNGQTYTGIIAYAAAKSITIASA